MTLSRIALAALFTTALGGQALAADTLKLAVGQRGNWDTAVAELGQQAGIFKKHDLDLDILYTQGGGETLQVVISGSAEIGVAAGTMGVLGAFSKGAPIRIIGAQATGAADFFYVPADSKLQTIKDATADTTIAYSSNGSSTNSMVLALIKKYDLKAKPVATGSPSATFTPVMTGQVSVGWSSPPFGFDALDAGKIRIIARGEDIEAIRDETIRTLVANAQFVDQHKDELDRFMQAYRETIDYMYSSDEALKNYAEFAKTDMKTAKRIRNEFFPKSLIDPDKIAGTDQLMQEAVTFKAIPEKLTDNQLDKLIQIPPRQ